MSLPPVQAQRFAELLYAQHRSWSRSNQVQQYQSYRTKSSCTSKDQGMHLPGRVARDFIPAGYARLIQSLEADESAPDAVSVRARTASVMQIGGY